MKLLIIGIDGGDRRIMEAMDMPFLNGVLREATHVPATEDLTSRGWAKILSGRPGEETGAFYAKPVLSDHGAASTQSYRSTDYYKAGVEPLWDRLNQMGLSVGFMNVPTTFPASKVNGFFVAGVGGGMGNQDNLPEGFVHPPEAGRIVVDAAYIADSRFAQSGLKDADAYFDRLKEMTERRVATYARLQECYNVDVGFIGFMATKSTQYLAMSEIEKMIAASGKATTPLQQSIAALFRHFDDHLGRLVGQLKPEGIMVVSDHGQVPYRHTIDMGVFLREKGWQVDRPKVATSWRRPLKKLVGRFLPRSMRKAVISTAPALKGALKVSPIDFTRSRAFSVRYVSGIYVNDSRFGGPVTDSAQSDAMVNEMVAVINAEPLAKEHSMRARPYRRTMRNARYQELLPDVWIDTPDTMFFEYGVGQFLPATGLWVAENPAWARPLDFAEITRDMWTGIKGRHPLLAVSRPVAHRIPKELPDDLTAAYEVAQSLCRSDA